MRRPAINAFYPITLSMLAGLHKTGVELEAMAAAVVLLWLNVAVHEAGHVVFARKAGHLVRRVMVLPGYGCTNIRNQGLRGRVTMIVAGPLAGALAAAAGSMTLLFATGNAVSAIRPEILSWLGWAMVADNLLNLVPYGVLDGQRAWSFYRRQREFSRWQAVPQWHTRAETAEAAPEEASGETSAFVALARRELDDLLACVARGGPADADAAVERDEVRQPPALVS